MKSEDDIRNCTTDGIPNEHLANPKLADEAYEKRQEQKGYGDIRIVPVVLEIKERHTTRQINAYLDKATQTIYTNSITVELAKEIGWVIKEK